MLVIVDYGVGNLFSLKSSFAFIGEEAVVSGDREVIASADRIILPGVGAFADAIKKLRDTGLDKVLVKCAEKGTKIMGICLGMQLLFETSREYGEHKGLGLVKGDIVPMEGVIPADLKIPHIGWNALKIVGEKHPIFRYINDGDHAYFVHSYYGENCDNSLIATTEYGETLTAAVAEGNVCGCQFHPEKSGKIGLNILRGFCEWK